MANRRRVPKRVQRKRMSHRLSHDELGRLKRVCPVVETVIRTTHGRVVSEESRPTMRELGGSRALRTLARIRLLRPSERGQCDLLFLEERPCFRRRQGLQFLRPPIAPMTISRAGFLIPFAWMATQFI